mgnify:CR=1 FL=1
MQQIAALLFRDRLEEALQDYDRAVVVGERTFGKGSVQMLFPLSDRSAYLKLTTSHYYLPLGKCIHREENSQEWGVDPDLTIEMTPEQMRAAIDARQDLDVLRDADVPDAPAQGKEYHVDWDPASAEKGGYPSFMEKEIHDQPDAVAGRPVAGALARARALLGPLCEHALLRGLERGLLDPPVERRHHDVCTPAGRACSGTGGRAQRR